MLFALIALYFVAFAAAQSNPHNTNQWGAGNNYNTNAEWTSNNNQFQDRRQQQQNNVVVEPNCNPNPLRHHQSEDLPREYLQAHHRFTSEFLKDPAFWSKIHENGVASTNTFTVGHLLAALGQETFDVPTKTIPQVLQLPNHEKVVESYAKQFDIYEEDDNKVFPTSYLFTPHDNIRFNPSVEHLEAHKQVLNLWKNVHAPAHINDHISVATHDHIQNHLLPKVPPFTEDVAGVWVDTFHYASDWEWTWKQVGKQNFNTPSGDVPLPTSEIHGAFPVLETSTFVAVAIPLEGEKKHAVFVNPKNGLQQFFGSGHVDEIFTNGPKDWPTKNVRVQIPHINVTLAHGFQQLQDDNLECVTESGQRPHYIQPIVQVVSLKLNHEEVEYSVATGVQINAQSRSNNFRHLQQGSKPKPTTNFGQRNNEYNTNTNWNNNNRGTHRYSTAEHVFDKPFFVWLHDERLGPFAFTALSSNFHWEPQTQPQRSARHHDAPWDFQEETKQHRWNCNQN